MSKLFAAIFNQPPEHAVAYLRARGHVLSPSFDWRELWQESHTTAFTVAKSAGYDILGDIQSELARAMSEGRTYRQFAADLTPVLQKKGWWGRTDMVDPVTGELSNVQLGSPRRLKIIYDTNMRTAHAAGNWVRIQENRRTHPYLRYVAVLDNRTRDEHRLWHGVLLPADHAWWKTHYPPNGWRCRCTVMQLSKEDMEMVGYRETAAPEIRVHFEKATDLSRMLFCHRNKWPQSEKRTVTLGQVNQKDGVIYRYTSPDDYGEATITLPKDARPSNPEDIKGVGVANALQAEILAYRALGKLLYGRTEVEFRGLPEANLLLPGYRILNVDNTRPKTQDGEVMGQEGLIVYTSQVVHLDDGKEYYAHLQLPDATVDRVEVLPGPVPQSFQLTRPTRISLETSPDAYAKAMYVVTEGQDTSKARPFLVTEVSPNDDTTAVVRGINYDERYYAHDLDFKKGLIGQNG